MKSQVSQAAGLLVAGNFEWFPVEAPHGWADVVWFLPERGQPIAFYKLTAEVYAALLARLDRARQAHATGRLSAEKLTRAEDRFAPVRTWAEGRFPREQIQRRIKMGIVLPAVPPMVKEPSGWTQSGKTAEAGAIKET